MTGDAHTHTHPHTLSKTERERALPILPQGVQHSSPSLHHKNLVWWKEQKRYFSLRRSKLQRCHPSRGVLISDMSPLWSTWDANLHLLTAPESITRQTSETSHTALSTTKNKRGRARASTEKYKVLPLKNFAQTDF